MAGGGVVAGAVGVPNPAAQLAEQIRTFAEARAIPIIEATVEPGEPSAIAQVMLDDEQVLTVLETAPPAILYLVAMPFTIDQLAIEAAAELGLGAEALPAPLAAQLRKLGAHDGEVCRVRVQFVIGGILHWSYASAPWLDAFDDAVEVAAQAQRAAAVTVQHVAADARAERVSVLARQLAAEPAFGYGQVSSAKRTLLAEVMFPDEARDLLSEVVERASQFYWLAQSGYSRADP